MDLTSFYIKRKQYLDNLKRKSNPSPTKDRMFSILSSEASEIAVYQIEQELHNICGSFEERFAKYLEEIENEKKQKEEK